MKNPEITCIWCMAFLFVPAFLGNLSALEWKLENESFSIVLPQSPSPSERFAAEELQTYFRKMNGAEIPIVNEDAPADGRVVILGRHPLNRNLWEGLDNPDHYILDAGTDRIRIVGGRRPTVVNSQGVEFANDWGILYGVYQLLEDQGIRWYRPEPEGEHVPTTNVLRVTDGLRRFEPSFRLRWGAALYATKRWKSATPEEMKMAKLWALRNRSNVTKLREPKYGGALQIGGGGHAYSHLVSNSMFATHPKFFPLIDGKRTPKGQLCLGNPSLQEFVAERIIERANRNHQWFMTSIDPNDGGGWCECDLCRALDDPEVVSARNGRLSMSSRVAAFNNVVAARVARAHPRLLLYCLAYASYLEPPSAEHIGKMTDNLVIGLAPFAGAYSDYSRPLRDPSSAPNRRFLTAIEGYSKLGVQMYAREYLSHYMWPGPLPLLWVMQDRFRVYRDFDFLGVYSETHPNWGPQGMILYFYLRLLWDSNLDLKAEVERYCRDFYGPAAEPMLQYHRMLEERGKNGPYFGSGGSHAENLFTRKFLGALRPSVDEARESAKGKEPYEWRVEAVLAGYEFARLYRRTEGLLNAQKLTEAEAAYAELDRFYGDEYPEGDVFNKGEARFRLPDGTFKVPSALRPLRTKLVKAGVLQEQLKNPRLVEMLDADWRFQIDPREEGIKRGWHQPDAADENWPKIDSGSAWQHQGFSDFHGTAWYRRDFASPKTEADQRIVLAFGAVDGDATVWLNGKEVGTHDLLDPQGNNRWDTPFTLDITDQLKPGENNTLVVRVKKHNGNGGIHRSVRLLLVEGKTG